MKKYVKPEVVETKEYAEGVYLASGGSTDNSSGPEEAVCRFGRKEANAGSDTCQECSKSGGQRNTPLPGRGVCARSRFYRMYRRQTGKEIIGSRMTERAKESTDEWEKNCNHIQKSDREYQTGGRSNTGCAWR